MNPTFQHSGEHPARLHKLSKCARAYLDGLVGAAMSRSHLHSHCPGQAGR